MLKHFLSSKNLSKLSNFSRQESSWTASTTYEMDKIRARGFLKHTYNYEPRPDIEQQIESLAKRCGMELASSSDWQQTELNEFDQKEKLLVELGESTKHFVPNSQLHKMKTLADVVGFYQRPVKNITKYAEMARSDRLPKNLAIVEHQRRFHPNDKSAPHGGISANPGEMGAVLGMRNKRLYRQYRPRKHWYEYEDVLFDADTTCSKGTPWDPEVARMMDSYTDVQFTKDRLFKTKN